jgi:hypothetical protein
MPFFCSLIAACKRLIYSAPDFIQVLSFFADGFGAQGNE